MKKNREADKTLSEPQIIPGATPEVQENDKKREPMHEEAKQDQVESPGLKEKKTLSITDQKESAEQTQHGEPVQNPYKSSV